MKTNCFTFGQRSDAIGCNTCRGNIVVFNKVMKTPGKDTQLLFPNVFQKVVEQILQYALLALLLCSKRR